MNEKQLSYPAAGLARSRAMRCFLSALFTAGILLALVNLLNLVTLTQQPNLFFLALLIAFIGGQIQERMRRLASQL